MTGFVALAIAAVALVLSFDRMRDGVFLRGTPLTIALCTIGVALVALALSRSARGRLEATLVALGLLAAAMILAGTPELPNAPSIASFGRSPFFYLIVLTTVGAVLAVAPADPRRSVADVALALFVVLAACGGPMFVRNADEFYGVLILFTVVATLCVRPPEGRLPLRVPFVLPALLFLAASLLPFSTTVDLDRHVAGILRAAVAFFPLLCLGFGPPDPARARFAVGIFAATAFVAAVCAAVAVLEAGWYFDLRLALDARLPLFGEHPNIIATFFAVAPPLVLALLLGSGRAIQRVLLAVTLVSVLIALGLTRSRASFLGAAAGVAVFFGLLLLLRVWRRRPRASTAVALAGIFVVGSIAGYAALHGRLADKLQDESIRFRVYLWGTALDGLADRPLTGFGYLTGDPLMAYAAPSDLDGRSKDTHPHNLVLAVALGGGVVSAALFLFLLVRFLAGTLAAAARFRGRDERLLAAGVVGSAVALLAANTLDQGLSLSTPVPLHLGLLLGLGSLLMQAARTPAATAAPLVSRPAIGRATAFAGAVGLTLLAVLDLTALAAERCTTRGIRALQAKDDEARRWTGIATAINPYSLRIGLRHVEALVMTGTPGDVRVELRRLIMSHPLSAAPWEQLSILEWNLMNWQGSLRALDEGRARDPTGPLSGEWSLRAARTHMALGDRDAALRELADATRYDYQAALRLPWRVVDGRWQLGVVGSDQPIILADVLNRNRALLPRFSQEDPVKARRLATALCRILMHAERFDEARGVIAEYQELANQTWLPLQYLLLEMDHLEQLAARRGRNVAEGELALPEPDAPAVEDVLEGDPPAAEEDAGELRLDEVVGLAGGAGVFLAAGQKALAEKDADTALREFHEGLARVYDIVAEQEYIALLLDGVQQAHLMNGELDEALSWLRPVLYFRPNPYERVNRYVRIARKLAEADRHAEALALVASACDQARLLHPSKTTNQSLISLGDCLLPYLRRDAAADHRAAAETLLEDIAGSAAGSLLRIRVLQKVGRSPEARALFEEFKGRYPAWTTTE